MSPRTLILVENWRSYKNTQVHLLFSSIFYCYVYIFVYIFVSSCPINTFLGLIWRYCKGLQITGKIKPVSMRISTTDRYLQVSAGTFKNLKSIPGSAMIHGNNLIRSRGCMTCGYFWPGTCVLPVDHPHSWWALPQALFSPFYGCSLLLFTSSYSNKKQSVSWWSK